MQNKVVVLLHGPYAGNAYAKIFRSLNAIKNKIEQVIISTYISDKKKTEALISGYREIYNIECIYNKDVINPGYFNLNRQIYTVKNGLECIKSKDIFVVKIRNDQWCNTKRLYKIINSRYFKRNNSIRILTTNCFTRADRFYHPSDMFLCGWKEILKNYYSMPLQDLTHTDSQLWMLKKLNQSKEDFRNYLISPESELFKHYLVKQGWQLKNTEQDSFNALKKYMYLVNTWDINLRWNKQRNAFLPSGTIILPYKFHLEPFKGAPKERARCYSRHDFEGKESFRDWLFIKWSALVFDLRYSASFAGFRRSLNRFVILFIPRKIRKKMLNSSMGKALKEFINC